MPKLYEIPVQFQLGQPVIPFAFKAHWQVHFNVVISRNQSPYFRHYTHRFKTVSELLKNSITYVAKNRPTSMNRFQLLATVAVNFCQLDWPCCRSRNPGLNGSHIKTSADMDGSYCTLLVIHLTLFELLSTISLQK